MFHCSLHLSLKVSSPVKFNIICIQNVGSQSPVSEMLQPYEFPNLLVMSVIRAQKIRHRKDSINLQFPSMGSLFSVFYSHISCPHPDSQHGC